MRIGRALGRGLAQPKFQGIRFRLGVALALALLPILLLGAFQAQQQFRLQDTERRQDLQLAAERTAASAKARLDSTSVLLQALRPEALELFCEPRLTALVDRLDDLDGLARLTPTGQTACASQALGAAPPPWLIDARRSAWFQRLRAGENTVLARAPAAPGRPPGLIVALRLERPLGAFDGAMIAVIPLASLQPDVADAALPEGSQAALTDAQGRILTATDADAFTLTGDQSLLGWVDRARTQGSSIFEGDSDGRRRVFAGAALAGRDVYALLSAPSPGLLSWARLNPVGLLLMPLAAWLAAFVSVMLFSERIVVRWLDYLERIAAIYARGRFSVRPVQAVNAPSEIRVLAKTLDELAETITTRDAALLASVEEKDALMREIHHRVKNNLQVITSLLNMQQRALSDPGAREAMSDTRQRISALALIYRALYQGPDLKKVDLRHFLEELIAQIVTSAEHEPGAAVRTELDADELIIDPDKLAPLALFAVEAINNAQKHAFAGRGGVLRVRFKVEGDEARLEIADDGGDGVASRSGEGVGRTLMTAFARQLRGRSEFADNLWGGATATLIFPTPEGVGPQQAGQSQPAGPKGNRAAA